LASSTTPEAAPSPAERATVIASARLAFAALPGGPPGLQPGEPELVHAIEPASHAVPGYWLVPGLSDGAILAVARILRDGRVATVASLPAQVGDCAEAVTGLSARQMAAMADQIARSHGGRAEQNPILVHDGPVGREAWLLAVESSAGATLLVFATAGGTYVRP